VVRGLCKAGARLKTTRAAEVSTPTQQKDEKRGKGSEQNERPGRMIFIYSHQRTAKGERGIIVNDEECGGAR
jgi:hypothetical protein